MLSPYVIVQGVPVPRKLARLMRRLLADSGARLQSCYRGDDARALLNRYGHSSQQQLWDGWVHRRPGFNPANPPGHSTHELRSDGVAYPHIPSGHRLVWWQVGIDLDDGHVRRFIAAAKRRGCKVWQPYPDGREFHHVNFRVAPPKRWWGVR